MLYSFVLRVPLWMGLAEDPPPAYDVPKGTPWLENRISRCFFSPIKRAPFYRDALTGDNFARIVVE